MVYWTPIHTALDRDEAELVKGLLGANDIDAIIFDQRSSIYPMMGRIEVQVDRDEVMHAMHAISNAELP
jgi:hypothetical protein